MRHRKLPWWTWVVPLPIFFIGTLISLESRVTIGTSLVYVPLPLALTLVYWWGPRVLPAFYINATLCAGLWGLQQTWFWPLYAFPEVVFAFLSWLFFVKFLSGKIWFPNTKQIIYFLVAGILLPLLVYKALLESIFVLTGEAQADHYWNLFVATGFGDFVSAFCISTPLLHFMSGFMARKGLVVYYGDLEPATSPSMLTSLQWLELASVAIIAYAINFVLGYADYWFLNGVLSLYVAMRFGFAATVLINSYILVITYVIPVAVHTDLRPGQFLESNLLKAQLGTALLYIFSIVTGRLVSELNDQNKILNKTNTELDLFVYSVSHDLTAPLKSILGLVNISRITNNQNDHRHQFDLIEKSVKKLETFVAEVLDYSKNKRLEVQFEEVNLKSLSDEVFDELKYIDGADQIEMDNSKIEPAVIRTDRIRMRIVLHNLISNAIKFRKSHTKSYVRIYTETNKDKMALLIEDNGQGIKPDLQPKIFNMFFKGTERSRGSGLGLYIAREVVKKINGQITVESKFGEGSTFRIELDEASAT
jgi:signal transduction histidine kinase